MSYLLSALVEVLHPALLVCLIWAVFHFLRQLLMQRSISESAYYGYMYYIVG